MIDVDGQKRAAGEAADGTFASPRDVASYFIARSELGSNFIAAGVFKAAQK